MEWVVVAALAVFMAGLLLTVWQFSRPLYPARKRK